MERHRCKLCSRIFSNGRALGGHMRSHLAILPLPPKPKTEHLQPQLQLGDRTESDSSSSTHSEKLPGYGPSANVNPNPNVVVKASDPELLDAGSVVQDRESETESTQNPTRRPSKRAGQTQSQRGFESKKLKPDGRVKSESVTESAPVSSVSDASQDEEVALCLMMLSRDVWERKVVVISEGNLVEYTNDSDELKTQSGTRWPRFKSLGCTRKVRKRGVEVKYGEDEKIYECPFCEKVFGSGQALGGHKRSHLLGSSSTNNPKDIASYNNGNNENACNNNVEKLVETHTNSFILDLNLPAPLEDGDDR